MAAISMPRRLQLSRYIQAGNRAKNSTTELILEFGHKNVQKRRWGLSLV